MSVVVSESERYRWERWYEQTNARMQRQSKALTRVVMLLTEATAALHEIAALDGEARMEGTASPAAHKAVERAREALARMEESAAATVAHAEELASEPEPEDPRRKY